jgi:hypothetical protein
MILENKIVQNLKLSKKYNKKCAQKPFILVEKNQKDLKNSL